MTEAPALTCRDDARRRLVRQNRKNGLDYVEVELFDAPGKPKTHPTQCVHVFGRVPTSVRPENILIEGGRRIPGGDIVVLGVVPEQSEDPERDDCLRITVDRAGDFSLYTLSLVQRDKDTNGKPIILPYPGFDQRYYRLQFSFRVDCPTDIDCKVEPVCPPLERKEPEINYLAKDYASFRQLILDRLALIMPDCRERHVPDLGIALVEIVAYVGDHLSYYQDAVATEAYLDTARQRISVRRHARLVDYRMHEGCNARAWVCVDTDSDFELKGADVFFITRVGGVSAGVVSAEDLQRIPRDSYEVFEPIVQGEIKLRAAHSRMTFYAWGDRQCCLPCGATSATLLDTWATDETAPQSSTELAQQGSAPKEEPGRTERVGRLDLKPNDVLIFEEVKGAKTGKPADADPSRRHAVRLTKATPIEDRLTAALLVEIEWRPEDALPFPLCISAIGPAPDCTLIEDISVASGNVVMVDHGRRVTEDLGVVEEAESVRHCEAEGRPADVSKVARPFRPTLREGPLTFRQSPPLAGSASAALQQDPRDAVAQVLLTETEPLHGHKRDWVSQADLLDSESTDLHFVAEVGDAARARLRFGDGELGRQPEPGTSFTATYRVGSGRAGNVGAEAISHIVFRDRQRGATLRARNPLPARSGVDLEPLTEVKLLAPHAFRSRPERAITADDYARLVERTAADHFIAVQRAAAALRWTGSWYEAKVAIDPAGTEAAGPEVVERITDYLHRYRRMGHDLVVQQARYVPLDIELHVCVLPHYLRGHVEAALLDVLSNRVRPDGQRGFFHPDNLSFGGGIFLSQLVAAAQAVSGIESVRVTKLERLYEGPNGEIANGVLPLGPTEIAQVAKDPNFPEHGKLTLVMGGGR
jgi:hypothetical protein